MKYRKILYCWPALLVLAGCGKPAVQTGSNPPPLQLTTISVTCTSTTVVQRTPTTCTASAADQNGAPFPVSGYTWVSSDMHVAKVDAQGNVTTSKAGTAIVTASATEGGITQKGQATLTVNEHAPTYHSSNITTSQTWALNDSPHVVQKPLLVDGTGTPPTLTLEAGVEVRFDEGTQLTIQHGALQASGSSTDPILLEANQSVPTKGFWSGLVFKNVASPSLLQNVTLSDCGLDSPDTDACLMIYDNKVVRVQDITVSDSVYDGVIFQGDGGFAPGSSGLTITGCDHHPMDIKANSADSVPTGVTLTGSSINTIALFGGPVTRSQQWPNPGVPYSINYALSVDGIDQKTPIVLTLSEGTVLRFSPDGSLDIGGNSLDYLSDLVVNGTEANPVRFTADSDSPKPGMWKGVHFGESISNITHVSHAIFEYAGGDRGSPYSTGILNMFGYVSCKNCPVLDHVTVQKGSSYGITMHDGLFSSGLSALTVTDNGDYAIVSDADMAGSIPAGTVFSGNSLNAIAVSGNIISTQAWSILGTPYVVVGNVDVGYSTNPTLTVAAGAELRFAPGTELTVGGFDATRPGALVVAGTAQAPVLFGPNTSTPTKGSWGGVHFMNGTGSQVDHALISYAGGGSRLLHGNLNVYQERGGFVKNSTFSNGSACGIMVSKGTASGTDKVTTDFTLSTYGNAFQGNTTAPQCTD